MVLAFRLGAVDEFVGHPAIDLPQYHALARVHLGKQYRVAQKVIQARLSSPA